MKEIVEALPNDWELSKPFELGAVFDTKDENGNTITITASILGKSDWIEFFADYYEWGFSRLDDGKAPLDAFLDLFACWKDNIQKSLNRIFEAQYAQYDPISNYDRTEQHERSAEHDLNRTAGKTRQGSAVSYSDSGAESVNGGRVSANTKNATTTVLNASVDLVSDYSDGENRATPETSANATTESKKEGFTISGIGVTTDGVPLETTNKSRAYDGTVSLDNTTTQTGSTASRSVSAGSTSSAETEAESGNEKGTNSETETIRAFGNIGVTTNAQMVAEEIKLRFEINLAKMCIEWFVKDCLFYGGW